MTLNFRTFSTLALLSHRMQEQHFEQFCSSVQDFAFSFLQIPPHDGHPCCSANCSHYQAHSGLSPPSYCPCRANKKKGSSQLPEPLKSLAYPTLIHEMRHLAPIGALHHLKPLTSNSSTASATDKTSLNCLAVRPPRFFDCNHPGFSAAS